VTEGRTGKIKESEKSWIVDDGFSDFELWPENKEAFDIFAACQTQWRVIPMSGLQGLDYHAVESVIRMNNLTEKNPQLFNNIRLIESGALKELNNGRKNV